MFLMIVFITVAHTQLPLMGFGIYFQMFKCLVLLGDLIHVVRDVGRILSIFVICTFLIGVENCKKILINSFILLLHNVVVMKQSKF